MSKTIVITGGGGVLCSALAKSLAKQKHKIVVLSLKEEKALVVVDEIRAAGGKAIGMGVNVLDKESLKSVKDKVNKAFGPCDILINGAGGNHPDGTTSKSYFEDGDLSEHKDGLKTFFDLTQKGIEFVFNLNFMGTLLPTQVFAEDMVGREGCSVLNISSMSAYTPLTKIPAYSGAKAAISNFTQWMAVHFSKVGIRVNALAPGFFLTEQNRTLLTTEDGELTARGNQIIDQTPMGTFGKPEHLIGATNWLCGDEAQFVTGIVVPVDGGFNAFSGV